MRSNLTPTLLLVGGFLGAGKTTWIGSAAKHGKEFGRSCAIITNDQAGALIDTQTSSQSRIAVEEVNGSCFCCNLPELVARLDSLRDRFQPELIFAEPVGSCTDLIATISLALRKIYDRPLRIAPLTVIVDARRASAHFIKPTSSRRFSKEVGYIFNQQIEESQILVINKIDLLNAQQHQKLQSKLLERFPRKTLLFASAFRESDISDWLLKVENTDSTPEPLQNIDYERYGRAEALLGWVNIRARVASIQKFNGGQWIESVFQTISLALRAIRADIAHFKATLLTTEGEISRIHQVSSYDAPDTSQVVNSLTCSGELLINLRAEGDPDQFRGIIQHHLEETGIVVELHEAYALSPSMPSPTLRVTDLT